MEVPYQGYLNSKGTDETHKSNQTPVQLDRFLRHTQLCSSCNRAYQLTNKLKQTCVGVAIALAALAIITDSLWIQIAAVSALIGAVALATGLGKLKTHFERSYTRH